MKQKMAIVASLLLATAVFGDSLYSEGSFFTSMFGDRKAAGVGDVVHILITESATATQSAGRTHSKNDQITAGPGTGWADFIKMIGYSGSSNYAANATATRSGTITTRLTVMVKEVLPNGNLLIEGGRQVLVNKDQQNITICGEIRPQDLQRDNTIYSYQVANVNIEYAGSDPRTPGSKVGIISRIIHYLF